MIRGVGFLLLSVCLSFPVRAAEVGRETGFSIPRFVSMRAEEANVRRGPSTQHRIDWVFERPGLPVVVRGEFGHWRLIEDADGDGGWVHRALISGRWTGLVLKGEILIRTAPTDESEAKARVRHDVIVEIEECGVEWCNVSRDDIRGWVRKDDIWGVDASQIQAEGSR